MNNHENNNNVKPKTGKQFKGIFITDNGKDFICIRELYCMTLSDGQLIDGKTYQGMHFLLQEPKEEKDLLMEKES